MQELGSMAPGFSLPNTGDQGGSITLQDFSGKPLLVTFICNHCPFVIHVIDRLASLGNEYQAQGFGVIAISANDVQNYPQDAPEHMTEFARRYQFEFPYCYDETQDVAKSYGAECTPDFFVYDADHKLRYRGQMDDSRPGNSIVVTGRDLDDAMQAVLQGREVNSDQKPSIGCNIKWKQSS